MVQRICWIPSSSLWIVVFGTNPRRFWSPLDPQKGSDPKNMGPTNSKKVLHHVSCILYHGISCISCIAVIQNRGVQNGSKNILEKFGLLLAKARPAIAACCGNPPERMTNTWPRQGRSGPQNAAGDAIIQELLALLLYSNKKLY